jgi:aryl-alcohol dehydrogenase-like predicted oxidoreductase
LSFTLRLNFRSYDLGIQTFDTANIYSHGLSEVVLGKAIKQHNLPRDGIVVMTKVSMVSSYYAYETIFKSARKLYFTVAPTPSTSIGPASDWPNQNGLSRKVYSSNDDSISSSPTAHIAHL